jgi:dCMP deaminase
VALIHKDGVAENTHPLNLVEGPEGFAEAADRITRPPLYEVYMRMAEELAKRSTCARLQVGTVITDPLLEHVVAIGYNGNARGFPNRCDSDEAGRCGCIHSEMNALVKAPGQLRDKVAFITASPCVMCAKLIVQANISHVFYREAYRDPAGLGVLQQAGVATVRYARWNDLSRG